MGRCKRIPLAALPPESRATRSAAGLGFVMSHEALSRSGF